MGRCCLWRCRVALREEHFWWGCCLWWRCRREDAITPGLLELQHRYSFVGRRSAGQMQRCDVFAVGRSNGSPFDAFNLPNESIPQAGRNSGSAFSEKSLPLGSALGSFRSFLVSYSR